MTLFDLLPSTSSPKIKNVVEDTTINIFNSNFILGFSPFLLKAVVKLMDMKIYIFFFRLTREMDS